MSIQEDTIAPVTRKITEWLAAHSVSGGGYHCQWLTAQSFRNSFDLPDEVDLAAVGTHFEVEGWNFQFYPNLDGGVLLTKGMVPTAAQGIRR